MPSLLPISPPLPHLRTEVLSLYKPQSSHSLSVCTRGFLTSPCACCFWVQGDANVQIASISEELAKKTEDAARQQEEITHLLSQIVDLQKKAKAVSCPSSGRHRGAALGLRGASHLGDRALPFIS